MTFTIDSSDLDAMIAELRAGAVDTAVDDAADSSVTAAAAIALRAVRAAARRHRRTGRLEAGTTAKVSGSGVNTTAVVSTTDIGAILVSGQQPHAIRPLHARALAFAGPVARFAGGVQHPGVPPDPFMAHGLANASGELAAMTDDTASDLAARVAARLEG